MTDQGKLNTTLPSLTASLTGSVSVDFASKSLRSWVRQARPAEDPEPAVKSVHGYTSLSTLAAMFSQSSGGVAVPSELWASSAPHMNDAQEFEHGRDLVVAALESIATTLPGENDARSLLLEIARSAKGEDVYCTCFSAKPDDLGQWRGYGDDGRGCSVEYDVSQLEEAHQWLSGWVVYRDDSKRQVASILATRLLSSLASKMSSPKGLEISTADKEDLQRLVPSMFVFFKHRAFAEEAEYRLIYAPRPGATALPVYFQERRGRIVPFVKLPFSQGTPITSVMFGPRVSYERAEASARHMLRLRMRESVVLKRSDIPYLV